MGASRSDVSDRIRDKIRPAIVFTSDDELISAHIQPDVVTGQRIEAVVRWTGHMDDEAGIACISRGGRTDGDVCLIRGGVERGTQCNRLVAEAGAGGWLWRNQNRERRRALLPTLRRT